MEDRRGIAGFSASVAEPPRDLGPTNRPHYTQVP
jgi:hypothetical protein